MKRRTLGVPFLAVVALSLSLAAVPGTAAPLPATSRILDNPATSDTPTGVVATATADAFEEEELTVTRSVQKLAGENRVVTTYRYAVADTSAVEFNVPNRVDVDQSIPLSGKVKVKANPGTRRPVRIEQRVGDSWLIIWKGRAALSTGKFTVEFPGIPGPMLVKMRAKVLKSDGLPAAVSKAYVMGVGTEDQVAALKNVNTAKDWTWGGSEAHEVWEGCNLTWGYKSAGGYSGALGHLKKSVTAVNDQSAFGFSQVAEGEADIIVKWATPKQESFLKGGTLGVAMTQMSDGQIIDSVVFLDKTEKAVKKKFNGKGMTWGAVMMHELGHTQGLGHAAGKKQVMYRASATGTWGKGDKTGIAKVSEHCAS